ncbi:MAG: nitroreductase family protein, partial [Desulfovibrio sp.]|nr:nitroreductase family protein [Desulfovibrio sp.]
MDFRQLVESARTCRRFHEDKPLCIGDLEWLVDCARMTPSARNAQVLRYILVGPGETCQELFTCTRWAAALKDWGGPFPGERPTGFVAIASPANGGELAAYDAG